jgi:phospho-N-acetylmuramoyl-pentapeptide-transferase
MLYHLFQYLEKYHHFPGSRLFQYTTFRAGAAIILSLTISMVFGAMIIRFLKNLQIGETVRDLGLDGQKAKEGTPTMGGMIIILSIVIPVLLLARLDNIYTLLMLLATTWMGIIGFTDDYIKVFRKDKQGLQGKFKILGQVGFGLIIGIAMVVSDDIVVRMDPVTAEANGYKVIKHVFEVDSKDPSIVREFVHAKAPLTNVPFFKGNEIDYSKILPVAKEVALEWYWIIFIPFVIFIVTAVSNAANITDGIDGLATGLCAIIGATLGILAYVSSNVKLAEYLDILYIPNSQELVVYSACFLGACIGFLWYNTFPAKVFMGDTGSLTLGGIIAAMAILIRKEFLIPVLCGILFIEILSVVLQVSYFKYTKKRFGEGRRIFLMSPLHHHFQKKGIHEAQLVTRFWIIGILLAVVTIITLKVR